MTNLKPFLAPIVVAVLALAGLASCQGSTFRESIEGKLTDSSTAALAEAGIDDARVRFAGRDATVEADTTTVASTAGGIVQEVDGVRTVRALGPDGEVEPGAPVSADGETDTDGSDEPDDAGTDADRADGPQDAEETGEADDTGDDVGQDAGSATGPDESDDDGSDPAKGSGEDSDDTPGDDGDEDEEPTTQQKKKAQKDLVKIPNITFVTDSATLTEDGEKVVRHAADVLAEHPGVRVRVDGHTDHVGPAKHNEKLSQRRAETVVKNLVDLGIDSDRLTGKGFGESDPVIERAKDLKELGKNRRVEFTVVSNG